MKQIKYICFYDTKQNEKEQRATSLAAENKVKYLSETLVKNGYQVEIVNPAWTYGNFFCKAKRYQAQENIFVKLFLSFPWKNNKFCKGFSVLFQILQLFFYLLIHIKKNETVVVYHSLYYASILNVLKKIKRFHLLLEAEEIYTDVKPYSSFLVKAEYKVFRTADSFLFANHLLSGKINTDHKPYAVFNGTYTPKETLAQKFSDGKIHLVYSGIIDSHKGGAGIAVGAAAFLNETYHLHILGFGSDRDVAALKAQIKDVSENTACNITFEGVLYGEEFQKFLQSCHIGLSTQNPDKKYNDTSFPSKVLVYLTNGLRVVSADIPVVTGSAVGDLVDYYSENTPQNIADAIRSIDVSSRDETKKQLEQIDSAFRMTLHHLLKS